MFLPDKITFLENTKDVFSPREGQEIELCRAGEYPENKYLYNKEKKETKELEKYYRSTRKKYSGIRRVASRISSFGPKYIYQCGTCGKRFYRKTQNSTVRPHKSKSGFTCYGHGIYVGLKY